MGVVHLFLVEALGRAGGSLVRRPYVFGFLAAYLIAAAAAWGWRRAVAFTVWAGSLAFAAEWSSTRSGSGRCATANAASANAISSRARLDPPPAVH